MRDYITLFINGERHQLTAEQSMMTVADYLRYKKGLTGTKIVCAEGDCGACTVLTAKFQNDKLGAYKAINACISFMYLHDKSHLITVEGLGNYKHLHPVQEAMVKHHGAQCGYCTPGFICSMASLCEDSKKENIKPSEQKIKNYLTGNLCRCTGYEPIIEAGLSIDINNIKELSSLYNSTEIEEFFRLLPLELVELEFEDRKVFLPSTFKEAVRLKNDHEVDMISGATDLGVLHNKRKKLLTSVVSLNNINEAFEFKINNDTVQVGAKVSLDDLVQNLKNELPEFVNMLHIFASPQIKNTASLVGNIVNASPISDTIPFLKVAEASLEIESVNGKRVVKINDFFKGGYKELDLNSNEIVTKVIIPLNELNYKLYKVSIRKDLDISTVTFAASYKVENEKIKNISIAYGGVGPTVLRLAKLESELLGKKLEKSLGPQLKDKIKDEISPLSDLRGSDNFRFLLCKNLFQKFIDEVAP